MKKFLAAFMFLYTAAAFAEVKVQGTFVPTLCSSRTNEVGVQSVGVKAVCLGRLEGLNQDAIQLTLNDGDQSVYAITLKRNQGGMGVSKSSFAGNLWQIRVHDPIEGVLVKTSGITTTYHIVLKTLSNLSIRAPVYPVMVTQ